ncbi:hypothetical protein QQX98_009855 [Neonectria punicea]|uniref:Uncharacterized protein n=1 Tax=Neonectria punicea TaxID=979145 RepID=A0ABR1GRG5_9HYPO
MLRIAYGFENRGGIGSYKEPLDDLPELAKVWVIRIESEPIAVFLERLHNIELHDSVVEMFAPFRTLIQKLPVLRDHLYELEKRLSVEGLHEEPALVYETKTALTHFRILTQFMDKYLGSSVLL